MSSHKQVAITALEGALTLVKVASDKEHAIKILENYIKDFKENK